MRLAHGIVLNKDDTFGRLRFSDLRRKVKVTDEEGEVTEQVKVRTYDNRVSSIKKHFAYFYKFAVCDIEPIHVQKWQLKLARKYSSTCVRNIHGLFSIAMDRAIILEYQKIIQVELLVM